MSQIQTSSWVGRRCTLKYRACARVTLGGRSLLLRCSRGERRTSKCPPRAPATNRDAPLDQPFLQACRCVAEKLLALVKCTPLGTPFRFLLLHPRSPAVAQKNKISRETALVLPDYLKILGGHLLGILQFSMLRHGLSG